MCSPGSTFQSVYLQTTFHCWGSQDELVTFRSALYPFLGSFSVHLCLISSTKTMVSVLRHDGARASRCLCPPGSVTGICPCRVKRVQGLSGYCTQGPDFSPKRPTLSLLQLQFTAWDVEMWLNVLCEQTAARKGFFLVSFPLLTYSES